MMTAHTYSNFPAVRPLPPQRAMTDEMADSLMARGQRMYARFNTPMRAWPATEKVVTDLSMGRLLWEQERQRQQRSARQSALRKIKSFKVSDRPRVPPFRGEFIKRAIQRFKLWHSKRQAIKDQDFWLRGTRKVPFTTEFF